MDDIVSRIWENLTARTEGPMHLRFFLQPTMSLIFAIRAGLADARTGAIPYLWRFLVSKGERKLIAREGWKDFGKIFIVGMTLDIVYQLIVVFKYETEERFYPLESIIVAVTLAIIPYLIFRGPVSRLMTWMTNRK